jgi:hypothetical protein
MDGIECCDSLHLDNYQAVYEQVETRATVKRSASIRQWKRFLSLKGQAPVEELE